MAHKKHKPKQPGIDHRDISAEEAAKASSSIGPQPLMSTKHDLPNDADEVTTSGRPKKRRKINSNTGLEHHDLPASDISETSIIENIERPERAPDTSAQELPPEVRHLSSKYDFTTMSILSSAKISDKVKKVLLRVENFSFADPNSKPGIVVLHAKSEVASKMVSIVEIARQDIERDKGQWWQYSKLDGQLAELKTKSVKGRGDGKTLLEWQNERAGEESQGGVDEVGGEPRRASEEVRHDHEVVDGNEEMEDAFEIMVNPKEADQRAKQSGNGNGRKIRATPVMTIYFARVPVPGLKELYGSSDLLLRLFKHPANDSSTMSSQPLLQTAPGKRIALPTRVEPKVFFANERTFLSWLNFTVILGGLSIGLLNFGSDATSRICAGLFTIVAMGCMIYALVTFHWRARSIRLRGQGGFDDRFGPTVLAVVLAGAVVVNFVLRVTGT